MPLAAIFDILTLSVEVSIRVDHNAHLPLDPGALE